MSEGSILLLTPCDREGIRCTQCGCHEGSGVSAGNIAECAAGDGGGGGRILCRCDVDDGGGILNRGVTSTGWSDGDVGECECSLLCVE